MEHSGPNENHPEYPLNYVGYHFVKQYYDCMSRTPEQAWRFYAERGYHMTVYADGTAAVADTWSAVQTMLLRTASADGKDKDVVDIDTALAVPGGPPGQVLVMAAGHRFSQSFVIERQTSGKRTFAVVASVTRFLPDNTTRRPPPPPPPPTSAGTVGKRPDDGHSPADTAATHGTPRSRASDGARPLPDLGR